jgi:hypothetical protein
MLPKTLNYNMFVERDHLKNFKIALIQLAVFNEDKHMAKSTTFKKVKCKGLLLLGV